MFEGNCGNFSKRIGKVSDVDKNKKNTLKSQNNGLFRKNSNYQNQVLSVFEWTDLLICVHC